MYTSPPVLFPIMSHDDNMTTYAEAFDAEKAILYSDVCEITSQESIEKGNIEMSFLSILAVTKDDPYHGAILFEVTATATGEIQEVWVPKTLCRNLSESEGTVWVWNTFAKKTLQEYIEERVSSC